MAFRLTAGAKSSEFWLTLLGVAGMVLGPENTEHTKTLVGGLIGVYTAGRALVKAIKGGS